MIYIETGSTDVYYNFGLENYFTVEKRLPDTVFLFWRTTPTLMVGKYQNILEEINKPYADAHGIHLVRRMSGGGTIYTDLGGWQFSFIQLVSQGKCLCIPLICHDIFLGHSMCLLKILGLIIFLQNIQSPVFPIQIDHAWPGCLGLHLQIRQLLLPVGIIEFGRKRAISAIA
jgi:hypothetical protein